MKTYAIPSFKFFSLYSDIVFSIPLKEISICTQAIVTSGSLSLLSTLVILMKNMVLPSNLVDYLTH